jgi:DNA-directed RNA polymerase specialized sigma24 family protein
MGRRSDLSIDLRERIIQHHKEGKTLREICKYLKLSMGAVTNTIKVILINNRFYL